MKILLATGIYPPQIGGPATYAKLLVDELPNRGIEVDVLAFRKVQHYPRLWRHLVYCYLVWRHLADCDLVFTQDPVSTGIPVVCAARLRGKKVILRVAGDYAWEQSRQRFGVTDSVDDFQHKSYGLRVGLLRWLQSLSVRWADVVITPSQYFNKLVSAWNQGRKLVVTIYNGVDLNLDFSRLPKYEQMTIISAGRLVPWKGFDTLIRALSRLPEWQLLIAGDGPDRQRLVELVSDLGLEGRVRLLGSLPRSELWSQIYRSHVFVILTTFESFSFQIVEAMNVGVPVIASNIGNIGEIVNHAESGLLISPTDTVSLANYLDRVIREPDFVDNLIKRGRNRAQLFSIQKTLDQLVTIFRSCL